MAIPKIGLDVFGISLDNYNRTQLAPWRLPYFYEIIYNKTPANSRVSAFGQPLGFDGTTRDDLVPTNLAVDYSFLGAEDKAKIDEICFIKLASKAYDVIRLKGNPSIGDNIDFLYAAQDTQSRYLLSADGKSYISAVMKSAIYSQVQTWMLNNPFERTNSSTYSSNSGQSYSLDASNWLSNWDQLCIETKTIMQKSRLYTIDGERDDFSDFWETDPADVLDNRPTIQWVAAKDILKNVKTSNPIVLQDYVDKRFENFKETMDDSTIIALEIAPIGK